MNTLPVSEIFMQKASNSSSIYFMISFTSLEIPLANLGLILLKSWASFSLS